jgi:hypothetical protein
MQIRDNGIWNIETIKITTTEQIRSFKVWSVSIENQQKTWSQKTIIT